jgi:hypothetical protein
LSHLFVSDFGEPVKKNRQGVVDESFIR